MQKLICMVSQKVLCSNATIYGGFMSIYIDKVTFKKKKMLTMADFHSHPYFEIYYLVNGSRFFMFSGDEMVKISTGEFLFVAPNVEHKTKGTLTSSYNIRMELKDIPSEMYVPMLQCATKFESISIPADKRKHFEYQMEELYNEFTEREKHSERMLHFKTIILLIDIIRFATENITPSEKEVPGSSMEKITSYIDENFKQHLTLSHLASVVNMSESYFSHQFKKIMGITPIDYINKQRVEIASKLILENNLTASEIAEKTGFKNASYFCVMFKKYTGLSPREYSQRISL